MKTFKLVLIILVSVLIVIATIFFMIGYFRPEPAGISVSTNPQSNVYINGEFVGKTPLQKTLEVATISLKLVPEISDQNLLPYETKITLVSGIQTIIRREFRSTEEESSGDIISFEKTGGRDAGLIVVSTPDNAQVSIDGVPRGFAPYKVTSISPAQHQVTIKAEGYDDRVMTVKTLEGFRLTLFAKLGRNTIESNIGVTPTPTPVPTSWILVLDTPTGYLRVRTGPGSKGEEIGQIKPGDKFPLLETDEETGWYKIMFVEPKAGLPNGITGWVSNQYTKIIEVSENPSPSPSRTP